MLTHQTKMPLHCETSLCQSVFHSLLYWVLFSKLILWIQQLKATLRVALASCSAPFAFPLLSFLSQHLQSLASVMTFVEATCVLLPASVLAVKIPKKPLVIQNQVWSEAESASCMANWASNSGYSLGGIWGPTLKIPNRCTIERIFQLLLSGRRVLWCSFCHLIMKLFLWSHFSLKVKSVSHTKVTGNKCETQLGSLRHI